MAKRLILMRHAKSDWSADYAGDHERPLSKRGRRAAPRMGRYLTTIGWRPEAVITSSAVRARRTAELAAEAGGWSCEIEVQPRLYGASVADVREVVRTRALAGGTLLVVGHEPTWSASVSVLSGGGPVRMPTAAVAGLVFDVEEWDLQPGRGELQWLVTPRMLPDA